MSKNWKCIFKDVNEFYFAKICDGTLSVSNGKETLFTLEDENVNGCAYDGEHFWISQTSSNGLQTVLDKESSTQALPQESYIRIVSSLAGKKGTFIVEIEEDGQRIYALYDTKQNKITLRLPIRINCKPGYETLTDLLHEENQLKFLGYYKEFVPGSIDEEIIEFARLSFSDEDSHAKIADKTCIYVDNEDLDGKCTDLYAKGFKYPLVYEYLTSIPQERSFSVKNSWIVYTSKQISAVILADVSGHIYHVFKMPEPIQNKACSVYFDEASSMLYFCTDTIQMYQVDFKDSQAVEKLNALCKKAKENSAEDPKKKEFDISFALAEAMQACNLQPASEKTA
jgi:hypothetical protein